MDNDHDDAGNELEEEVRRANGDNDDYHDHDKNSNYTKETDLGINIMDLGS